MTSVDTKRMADIVQNFANKRICVLGDLMLDKYLWGNVVRISPEAPVPVVEVQRDTSCLGGAGNVYHNLKSLGAFPIPVGVVGDDQAGDWIKKNVSDSSGTFIDKKRPTTVKTRIIAHHQQVVRVDQEEKKSISSGMEEKIFNFIRKDAFEGILISDYNKGLLTKSLMQKLLPYAQKKEISVFVDPKVDNFFSFSPVTLINPNHTEAEQIVHFVCDTDAQVEKAGEKMLSRIEAKYLILKRGERGLTVFEKGKKEIHIPTIAKEVFDVTGAGDTVIATASLALLSGASILEAAVLANAAAGVVVGKIGTATVTPDELISALHL
ncbi:MAG: D-glycero-beta-D-manno-heptose-7-phosphate kinase [Candidatus Aminicenantes bacterium]|nr:D-glycero-beta-D-manno-heptose-7-phosphate kinase [Candidatus Aminicenantes bacterium]